MKKNSHLIIFTQSNYSIVDVNHLINSFKKDDPFCSVSLLTIDENSQYEQYIQKLNHIFYLPKKIINNIFKHKLISAAKAISEYQQFVDNVKKHDFTDVHYFDQENLSIIMGQLVAPNSHKPIEINIDHQLSFNSFWAKLKNYHIARRQDYIYHPLELNLFTSNTAYQQDEIKISAAPEISDDAKTQLGELRNAGGEGEVKSLVGICLESIYQLLSIGELRKFIIALTENKKVTPVFLTNNSQKHQAIVDELFLFFQNNIVSLEAEGDHLISVLSNLDFFISCKNLYLHLAGLTKTPTLELREESRGSIPTLINSQNYFYIQQKFDASELAQVFWNLFENGSESELSNKFIYINHWAPIGHIYLNANITQSTSTVLKKYFILKLNNDLADDTPFASWEIQDKSIINNVLEEVKIASSHILKCLRLLKSAKVEDPQSIKIFFQSLNQIIDLGSTHEFTSIAANLFYATLEEMQGNWETTKKFNFIETALFKLKNNLQLLHNIVLSSGNLINFERNDFSINDQNTNKENNNVQ